MTEPTRTTVHVLRHGEVHNPDKILYGLRYDLYQYPNGLSSAPLSQSRSFNVDNQPPTVSLGDVAANVSGSVSLTATASGDTVQVEFQRRAGGASTWTTIATATAAPFSATLASGSDPASTAWP